MTFGYFPGEALVIHPLHAIMIEAAWAPIVIAVAETAVLLGMWSVAGRIKPRMPNQRHRGRGRFVFLPP